MLRQILVGAILLIPVGSADAQTPDASSVQLAMNQGLELEFPYFQEFADVVILQGGATAGGEFLFLSSARLAWRLDSTNLAAVLQQEIDAEVERQGDSELLRRSLSVALADKLDRIGGFAAGDTVSHVRFRVRLEMAGADWVITGAKIRESNRNPLSLIDSSGR